MVSEVTHVEVKPKFWIKFCRVVDIPDEITYTNFADAR